MCTCLGGRFSFLFPTGGRLLDFHASEQSGHDTWESYLPTPTYFLSTACLVAQIFICYCNMCKHCISFVAHCTVCTLPHSADYHAITTNSTHHLILCVSHSTPLFCAPLQLHQSHYFLILCYTQTLSDSG